MEYYVTSNQESDFKENDLMYEDIDLDNLSTITIPVVAAAAASSVIQSHSSSLSNGMSSSNVPTLMDISGITLNLHSHLLTNNS